MLYLSLFISNSFYQLDYRNNQSGNISNEDENERNLAYSVNLFFFFLIDIRVSLFTNMKLQEYSQQKHKTLHNILRIFEWIHKRHQKSCQKKQTLSSN